MRSILFCTSLATLAIGTIATGNAFAQQTIPPARDSWTAGTFWWLIYFFIVSFVAAFVARPLLKVHI